MKRALIFAALCAAAALAAPEAGPYKQRVREVVVKTAGGAFGAEAQDYVRSHVGAAEGAFVSQKDLAADQRALLGSGVFSDVRIFLEKEGDGVRVIYDVTMAPRIRAPIGVSGNKAFSSGKVRDSLGLQGGDRIDRARLDAACDKLREAYRKSYYNNAAVRAEISPADAEGFATVSVSIEEGPREKLLNFEFSGNQAVSSSELRSVLGRPAPYNPFRIFYSQWRLDAADRGLVRDRVAAAYRERGYLDAEVGEPALSRKTPASRPVMGIAIREGSRYTVAAAAIDGVTLFPEAEIRKAVSRAAPLGSPASDQAMQAVEKAVRDYYGARGYVETEVVAKAVPAPGAKGAGPGDVASTVQVVVREGFLAHIRSVAIRGNAYTKDKVIRRELAIAPGMVMDEVLAETSRRRVQNLGYFESVRMNEVPSADDPALRDVILDVAEKSSGTLMAGIGTSNIDNILGYIDISQNNFDILGWPTFRGAGQKIRLTASAGSSSNSGEISWTDPWFLDRKQSFSVSLYRREYSYSEYDETRIGGDVALSVPLRYGRLTAKVGAELVENEDFLKGLYHLEGSPDKDFRFQEFDDKYLRVPFRLSWSYDTRNHPFVPTSGSRNNVFAEMQNSSLGSDYDLYKVGVDLRQYLPSPLGDHFLALRLRAESVDCYGGTDAVPVNDRYFLGGARSVRGFRYRQIGPKALPDAATGGRAHPVGGQTLALFSAEYDIPVGKVLRLAAFYDVGNVWADPFDADLSELASSWGFGIRLDIPGFPIRLDYAMPIDRDDDYSRTERFVFSIGFE